MQSFQMYLTTAWILQLARFLQAITQIHVDGSSWSIQILVGLHAQPK